MNVRIAQLLTFNAGSWYNDYLEMSDYTIKLWMITNTYDDQEQNIAMHRAKYFLFDEIENTVFIDSAETKRCKDFVQVGLNVTSLPGAPADQLIGIMLFHKLNAIMEDRIRIVEIEISSGSGVIYLHSENETSEGLVQPDWWHTADLRHLDTELTQSDKVLSLAQNTVWRDLDLAWPNEATQPATGNVVVFADFKDRDETK